MATVGTFGSGRDVKPFSATPDSREARCRATAQEVEAIVLKRLGQSSGDEVIARVQAIFRERNALAKTLEQLFERMDRCRAEGRSFVEYGEQPIPTSLPEHTRNAAADKIRHAKARVASGLRAIDEIDSDLRETYSTHLARMEQVVRRTHGSGQKPVALLLEEELQRGVRQLSTFGTRIDEINEEIAAHIVEVTRLSEYLRQMAGASDNGRSDRHSASSVTSSARSGVGGSQRAGSMNEEVLRSYDRSLQMNKWTEESLARAKKNRLADEKAAAAARIRREVSRRNVSRNR
ncbi:MAG: hypothetical protein OXF02_03260 [Simkaniaceae bacterium]|nr:hypothetical protein [Simkaniaceae bacterium]